MIINGKMYVGQTSRNFSVRLYQYLWDSRQKLPLSLLSRAINKYDIDNFEIWKAENIPIKDWDFWEIELIKLYNTISPNGYNLDSGGHKNKVHTEKTKNKISKSNKGKLLGKKRSIESIQKQSNSVKGRKNPNYGKHWSNKQKENQSKKLKGKFIGKNNFNYGNHKLAGKNNPERQIDPNGNLY